MILTPSDRVKFIKESAGRLAQDGDWKVADITLETFGLITKSVWSGTLRDYCLEVLKAASDQQLLELAKHFDITTVSGGAVPINALAFWTAGQYRLFLSHLAANKLYATHLKSHLSKLGICCFVAHEDIAPSKEWQGEIEQALATCDALVAVMHPNFHQSHWTDQEIGYVMGRGVPVFSIRIGTDPYGFIGKFQGFNGNNKTAESIGDELFNALLIHERTRAAMGQVIVGLFERSNSFAQAKRWIGFLEKLPVWDSTFNARLKNAVESNDQVSGSWRVPDRVTALIKKWSISDDSKEDDFPF